MAHQVNYGKVPADHVYSSADWSPSELLREKQNWYCHLGFEILENLRVDTIDTSCFYKYWCGPIYQDGKLFFMFLIFSEAALFSFGLFG